MNCLVSYQILLVKVGWNDTTWSVLRVKDDGLLLSADFFLPEVQCRVEFKITDFGVNIRVKILALTVSNSVALNKSFYLSEFQFLHL